MPYSEPNRVVFAAYEAVKLGELAIDTIPIQVMERSTAWAELLASRIERLLATMDEPIL